MLVLSPFYIHVYDIALNLTTLLIMVITKMDICIYKQYSLIILFSNWTDKKSC